MLGIFRCICQLGLYSVNYNIFFISCVWSYVTNSIFCFFRKIRLSYSFVCYFFNYFFLLQLFLLFCPKLVLLQEYQSMAYSKISLSSTLECHFQIDKKTKKNFCSKMCLKSLSSQSNLTISSYLKFLKEMSSFGKLFSFNRIVFYLNICFFKLFNFLA